ncbi:tail spike protein [Salmonella phage PRF-SP4]|nr:tail spike protein [Salmonella phage PRF-SP4]
MSGTLTKFPTGSTQYKINFDYLSRKFVKVTLSNSLDATLNKELVVGNDYRFLSATTLEILASQSGFDVIQIYRQTSSELMVDFRDGSVLTSSDLTTAELQAIHIAEEGRDQTVEQAVQFAEAAEKSAEDAAASLSGIKDIIANNNIDSTIRSDLSKSDGYTMIGGLSERFSLPYKWVVVDNAPYNGDLEKAVSESSDGTGFLLGIGKSYDFLTFRNARNTKKNLTFVGGGVPELSADTRSLVAGTGTIIRGPMKTEAGGFQLVNLGVDCGGVVSDELLGGQWDDPIQCYGIGKEANVFIDNVKTLSHTNLTGPNYPGTHSLLLEILDGAYVGKVELIGGYHGLTLKGTNLDVMDAHCYGQRGDAFIIKSDSAAPAADIYVGRLKVGLRDNSKFTDVTMGGIYDAHDGVNIDNVEIGSLQVYNASWGLIPSNENTGYISNLRIGNYVAMNVYGNYYSLVIDGRCVGVNIGEHQCSNTSGGISIDPSSVNVSLGNGFSKCATKSGYKLGGNSLVHGNLIADENGEYGVDYVGGLGFDASKVLGYSNQFGLVATEVSALGSTTGPKNGWGDTGDFSWVMHGKMSIVNGALIKGAGAVPYTSLPITAPRRRTRIAAWGVQGSSMIPVECYVEANGDLNVVGWEAITDGNVINFSGQYLAK